MAKKTIRENPLRKTTDKPAEEEKEKLKPYGVYLTLEMRRDMEQIKAQTGMNNHALLQHAIKYFIQQFKAGKIKVKSETVNTLEL